MKTVNHSAAYTTIILQAVFFISLSILVFTAGCTKEGPVGPQGKSGNNNLMDPAILPQIVSTFPSDGSTGPYDLFQPAGGWYKPNFIVQLNKLIYLDGLWLKPSVVTAQGFNRSVVIQLYMNWRWPKLINSIDNGPYDNVLAFNIYDSNSHYRPYYEIGKTYSITIDTSLEDINENHLQQPYHFSFTPEPYFRVTSFYPTDHSTNISTGSYPSVSFNSPVDTSILSALHISPSTAGTWHISAYDSFTVSFQHYEPFAYNTVYTLSVDGNAHDAYGHTILAPATSSFTTVSFKVTATYPTNGSINIGLNSNIQISFSGAIDTSSARAAFSITPNTAGYLTPSTFDLSYYTLNGLVPNTKYTITLSTSLMSVDGVHLAAPYSFSFTADRFYITYTSPYDGENNVSKYKTIYVDFNGKIDTGSVRAALHISPYIAVVFWMNDENISFFPASQFAAMTTYTVIVDSTIRTKSGYHMDAPYTFSFKTGE